MKIGLFTMSRVEVERVTLIKQVITKELKQSEVASRLALSPRQVRRLVKAYRRENILGLVSRRRNRRSNHHHRDGDKEKAKQIIQQYYADFGPTLASEKLQERHELFVNKETLRQWMIEWGLWSAKLVKTVVVHQQRERRACFGELIQIDGSHHDWFEGRAEKCCLLVFIDDATSKLVGLRFDDRETTEGYLKMARAHLECYGRPLAYYSDKYSVFRVNRAKCEDVETQFGRAMRTLGIELICANTPQAKGRVERANGTLQDRLVKEMRLRNINTKEEGNLYLPEFIGFWNNRFSVSPRSMVDAHRHNVPSKEELDFIFSIQKTRQLSKNLEFSFNNIIHQIKTKSKGYRLRHATITVCKNFSGKTSVFYKGKKLDFECFRKQKRSPDVVSSKQIERKMMQIKKNKPSSEHPWRRPIINKKNVIIKMNNVKQ